MILYRKKYSFGGNVRRKKRSTLFLMFFIIASGLAASTVVSAAVLVEALLAKVGRDGIVLSDLTRYQDIQSVLQCADLRKVDDKSTTTNEKYNIYSDLLRLYIEEELIFTEARSRKNFSANLSQVVQQIQQKPACFKIWQELGKKYGKVYATTTRTREGETLLVRELEKRILVDRFIKEKIPGDRTIWIREAKVRIPVKIFSD